MYGVTQGTSYPNKNNIQNSSNSANRILTSSAGKHNPKSNLHATPSGIGKGGQSNLLSKQDNQQTAKIDNASSLQERGDIQESQLSAKQSAGGSAQRASIQSSASKNRMKAKTTYNQHASQMSMSPTAVPKLQFNGQGGAQQNSLQLTGRDSINAKSNMATTQLKQSEEVFMHAQTNKQPVQESIIQEVPTTETNMEDGKTIIEEFKAQVQNEQPLSKKIGGGILPVDKKDINKTSNLQLSRIPSSQKQQVSSTFHSPRLATKIKFNNQAQNTSSSTIANNMSMQISQTYQNAVPLTKIGQFSLASPHANEKQHSLTIDQRYSQNNSSQNADTQQNQDASIISHTAPQNPYNVGKINNFSLGSIMNSKDLKPSQQASNSNNSTNPFTQSQSKANSKQITSSSSSQPSSATTQPQKLYQNSIVKNSKLNSADRERHSNVQNSEYMVKGSSNNISSLNQASQSNQNKLSSVESQQKGSHYNNHHSSQQLNSYKAVDSNQQSSKNLDKGSSTIGLGGVSPTLSKSQVHQPTKMRETGTGQITKLNQVSNEHTNSDKNSVTSGTIQEKTPSHRERQRAAQTRDALNSATKSANQIARVNNLNPFQKQKHIETKQETIKSELIYVSETINKTAQGSTEKQMYKSPQNIRGDPNFKEDMIELSLKQQLSKKSSKIMQRKSNQNSEVDDDDLMDEALNDSLELKECMSFSAAADINQVKLNHQQSGSTYSSGLRKQLTLQPQESNSSKLQATNTQTPNRAGIKPSGNNQHSGSSNKQSSSVQQKSSLTHRPSTLGLGPKQQTLKQSVVQGKKTLTSLADTQKEQTLQLDKLNLKEAGFNSSLDGSQDNSGSNLLKQSKSPLEVNLSLSNLTMLPLQSISNQQIKTIDLRNNKLTRESLVTELFKLPNLWKLQLDNNQIEELPDYFQSLVCLRQLTVSQNQLKCIPQSIFKVKKLEKFDISQNQISVLSSQIGLLEQMKYLYIHNNLLQEIPTSIGQLKQIQQLSSEWFQHIPKFMDRLVKRNVPPISFPGYSVIEEDALLFQIQSAIRQHSGEYLNFSQFMINLFLLKGPLQLLNDFAIAGQSNILHRIVRLQQLHLFDYFIDKYSDLIDINAEDENQLTALVIALQENNSHMVDLIVKKFGDQLDLQNPPASQSAYKQSLLSQQSLSSMAEVDNKVYVHPLLLAYRNLLYDTAKKILKLMVRSHNKQLQSFLISSGTSHSSTSSALSRQQQLQDQLSGSKEKIVLDLNMKDEFNNTIFHYVFANFSANMALSVEHCQELLKILEDGNRTIPPTVTLKLNEINKQGMTPFDLAIESKSNFAVEFALYYNKNLLPAFQNVRSKLSNKETFDVNFHKNHLGITPLHRAVLTRNHKAIYLLLDSGLCNTFNVDKEFKTARDLCLKQRYLYQYLKKGELNQIRATIKKVLKQIQEETQSLSTSSSAKNISLNGVNQQLGLDHARYLPSFNAGVNTLSNFQPKKGVYGKRGIQHTNINFFQMMQGRGNRVKYNSWYTGVSGPSNKGFMGNLKDLNGNNSSSRQNTEQDNTMKVSDILSGPQANSKGSNQQSNQGSSHASVSQNRRRNSSSQQSNIEGQIRIEDVDDDEEEEVNLLKTTQQHQVQQSVTGGKAITSKKSIIDQDREREKSQSRQIQVLKASIIEGQSNSSNLNGTQPYALQISNVKSQLAQDKSKRLSQGSEKLSKVALALKQKEVSSKQIPSSKQSKAQNQQRSQASKVNPKSNKPPQLSERQQPGLLSPNQLVQDENLSKSNQALEDESQFEEFDLGNDNIDDEHGESHYENPTTQLPSRKYKHVMAVNNSKLSRKPYFKQIQQNRFEREFCMIMDSKLALDSRLKILYQTFTEVFKHINSSAKEEVMSYYKDGRELLGFLKLELDSKEFALQPLRHEILYFQEMLLNFQSSYLDQELLQPSALLIVGNQSSRAQRQNNNNFSLERGPLPIIQETQVESNNISPVKKVNNAHSKEQRVTHAKAETSRKLLQHPQASILSQHFSSQDLDSRESGSLQGSTIKRMSNIRHTNSTQNLDLQGASGQQYQQVQVPQLQLSMHSTIIVQNTSKQGSLASLGYESPKRIRQVANNMRDAESASSIERQQRSERESNRNIGEQTGVQATEILKGHQQQSIGMKASQIKPQQYSSPLFTRINKNSKAGISSLNDQSNLKMPSPSASQSQIKDSISRGKDLYVKKIQVQITNPISSSQQPHNGSVERQSTQNNASLNQKWKQLSINPQVQSSQSHGNQKIREDETSESKDIFTEGQSNLKLGSQLTTTPKTQKIGSTTNQQQKAPALQSSQLKNQRQSTLNQTQQTSLSKGSATQASNANAVSQKSTQQQQSSLNQGTTLVLVPQRQVGSNSTSMSHRSSSNPRNSLLGMGAATTSGIVSGLKPPSKMLVPSSESANQLQSSQLSSTLNQSQLQKNILGATKQNTITSQQSKLGGSGNSNSKPLHTQALAYSNAKARKK